MHSCRPLHARCGLGSDVTAAPPRCPEARAGGAQQITPTAPPPPHLPPRMLPVASKYTQRPRGAVGRWWWPSLAHASRVSLGGRHGRPRACVAVSMQAARDAQSRLTLETDATYVSCTSPSGPGSICPSERLRATPARPVRRASISARGDVVPWHFPARPADRPSPSGACRRSP